MFNAKLKIEKVIFTDLDAVLGGLITSTMLKPKYGQVDIIHDIRAKEDPESKLSDSEVLLLTKLDVISTCWDVDRTKQAVKMAGWENVRIYSLGMRHD